MIMLVRNSFLSGSSEFFSLLSFRPFVVFFIQMLAVLHCCLISFSIENQIHLFLLKWHKSIFIRWKFHKNYYLFELTNIHLCVCCKLFECTMSTDDLLIILLKKKINPHAKCNYQPQFEEKKNWVKKKKINILANWIRMQILWGKWEGEKKKWEETKKMKQ